MRTWVLVAAVVFSGCQAKAPELSPAERFNAETEALERLNDEALGLARIKNEATLHPTEENIKNWEESKKHYEDVKGAIESQRQRRYDALEAMK